MAADGRAAADAGWRLTLAAVASGDIT